MIDYKTNIENDVNNKIILKLIQNKLNSLKERDRQIILMAITFTIMAITLSCIYTSTDSTAGEKERGTLETILTFPVDRKELILGKYLAISLSGLVTLLIGVFLSIISLYFVKNNFTIYDNVIFNINIKTK